MQSSRASLVFIALGSISAVAACASDSEPRAGETRASRAALVGAPVDTSHTWSVGVCQGVLTDNADAGRHGVCRSCTGTLVAPNLVLTARHCVRAMTDRGPNGQYCSSTFTSEDLAAGGTRITTSATSREGTPVWHDAKEILVPSTNGVCEDDIALLVLAGNVPGSEATPIGVAVDRDLALDSPAKVAIVGRGYVAVHHAPTEADAGPDAAFALDVPNTDVGQGLRRVAENGSFLCIGGGVTPCVLRDRTDPAFPDFNWSLPSALFMSDVRAVYGDSGSGVLDQATFATTPTVLGVFTYFGVDDDGESRTSAAVRVDVHADFLRGGAAKAASAGGYALPAWAKTAPDAGPGADAGRRDAGGSSGSDSGPGDKDEKDTVAGAASGSNASGPAASDGGCALNPGAATRPLGWTGLALAALGLVASRRRRR